MKKIFKIIGIILLVVVAAFGGIISYVKFNLPDVGAADELKIEYTTERIERGRYLANSVSVCMDCHSKRDFTKFSGPLTPGTFGMGGDVFDHTVGMPGVFYAKNITPAGINRYTDGELYRVITSGVTKEGRAMFPLMPYPYFSKMDTEDIYSIIAYLRSLPAIPNEVPESKADFPVSIIINTIPQPAQPQPKPDTTDMITYGAYMANASGCIECHTPIKNGQIISELAFSGGRDFKFPDGSTVNSSNITPDNESGIGSWTEELFIRRFKVYTDSTFQLPDVKPGEFNTIMPWTMYAQMTEKDLAAIFTYLQSVKPISNKVVKFVPSASASE